MSDEPNLLPDFGNDAISKAMALGTVPWLEKLRSATNDVLKEAGDLHRLKGRDTPFNSDAVNWGDLHCVNALWYRDADGVEGPIVEIEEASPGGAYFLCEWVSNRLAELGFENVVAKTAW